MHGTRMGLLMYACYYHPELASVAQLCTDLCGGLKEDFDITVICTVPCYTGGIPAEYLERKYHFESHDGVSVLRVRAPSANKGKKASRVRQMLVYFLRALWVTAKAPAADMVFSLSQPPVLGGLLGVWGKLISRLRGKRAKLVYNIQDYNPEQIVAVGYSKNKALLSLMMSLDKLSCAAADKVIVVGQDMLPTMAARFTGKNGSLSKRMPHTVCIHNWMDDEDVYPLPSEDARVAAFRAQHGLAGKTVIMYSGNIGLFYDLEKLIEVIGRFRDRVDLVFPFVGDGALKERLMAYVREQNIPNLPFIPYQAKEELRYSLNAADVHWVVNAEGIKGISCPSKLYGVLAAAKPVLGVLEEGTDARSIIESAGCGYAVSPGDYEGIAELIRRFADRTSPAEQRHMGQNGYAYMKKKLTKGMAIEKYRQELLGCWAERGNHEQQLV